MQKLIGLVVEHSCDLLLLLLKHRASVSVELFVEQLRDISVVNIGFRNNFAPALNYLFLHQVSLLSALHVCWSKLVLVQSQPHPFSLFKKERQLGFVVLLVLRSLNKHHLNKLVVRFEHLVDWVLHYFSRRLPSMPHFYFARPIPAFDWLRLCNLLFRG